MNKETLYVVAYRKHTGEIIERISRVDFSDYTGTDVIHLGEMEVEWEPHFTEEELEEKFDALESNGFAGLEMLLDTIEWEKHDNES